MRETVQLALEARGTARRSGARSLWLPPAIRAERAKRAEAAELIDFLGLGRYADRFIAELSTGTRRIVELASVLAVAPRVICLDEPTAGVAQREAEAFGPLIKRVQQELDATLVVVEHDLPMILSISDRVYCMEAGAVIAEGTPHDVRNEPARRRVLPRHRRPRDPTQQRDALEASHGDPPTAGLDQAATTTSPMPFARLGTDVPSDTVRIGKTVDISRGDERGC